MSECEMSRSPVCIAFVNAVYVVLLVDIILRGGDKIDSYDFISIVN